MSAAGVTSAAEVTSGMEATCEVQVTCDVEGRSEAEERSEEQAMFAAAKMAAVPSIMQPLQLSTLLHREEVEHEMSLLP